MLQPRYRPALAPLVWQVGVAGPSNYRLQLGRYPSPSSSQLGPSPIKRRLHSSPSEFSSPAIPDASIASGSLLGSETALSAAPVASSPIPDSVTQLLLASPLSPGWTIILLTIFLRSSVTLPLTLWQRRRLQRTRTLVVPEMKAYNEKIALSLVRESRAAGKTYEQYRKSLKDALATYQRGLHRKYRTHPLPTMLVPLAVHIPLLVGLSLTIRKTVEMAGGWGQEGFWWLDQLGSVDSTGVLPIMGGLVAFANAEVVGKKVKILDEVSNAAEAGPGIPSPEEGKAQPTEASPMPRTPSRTITPAVLPSRLTKSTPPTAREFSTAPPLLALPRPRPKRPLPSSSSAVKPTGPRLTTMESAEAISAEREKAEIRTKFISTVMRIGAVLFIPIAAQVPSALALYWTVSMIFTFVQNLVLNRLDVRDAAMSKLKS